MTHAPSPLPAKPSASDASPLLRTGSERAPKRSLRSSEGGVVMVEYVTLLCLVTITGAATVMALGVPLMQLFRYVQMVIAMPIP